MPKSKSVRKNKKPKQPTPRRKPPREDLPPDKDGMELAMAALALQIEELTEGMTEEEKVDLAQDMCFDAWETRSPTRRVELAVLAMAIDSLCADAYLIVSEGEAAGSDEELEMLQNGYEAAREALGAEAFVEDVGHFWGLLETRPYMRIRHRLADALWQRGEREATLEHYRDMLRLNPNDNQGIRYLLASCLLATDGDEELRNLLGCYPEDGDLGWLYSRALEAFRRLGDAAESQRLLAEALIQNKHAGAYLLGERRLPRKLPEAYTFGSKEEAFAFVHIFGEGWQRTPGALEWLHRRLHPAVEKPPSAPRRQRFGGLDEGDG